MAEADPIDVTWLRKTFDDDAVLAELYNMYVGDSTKRLAELHEAFDAKDAMRCSKVAHTLNGSSGNVGAGRMREFAAQLEKIDWTSNPTVVADLVRSLDTEFVRVRAFVDHFVAGSPVAG